MCEDLGLIHQDNSDNHDTKRNQSYKKNRANFHIYLYEIFKRGAIPFRMFVPGNSFKTFQHGVFKNQWQVARIFTQNKTGGKHGNNKTNQKTKNLSISKNTTGEKSNIFGNRNDPKCEVTIHGNG